MTAALRVFRQLAEHVVAIEHEGSLRRWPVPGRSGPASLHRVPRYPLSTTRALVGPTHQAAVDQFLPEGRLIAGYPSGW
jgi:hypothetical protein